MRLSWILASISLACASTALARDVQCRVNMVSHQGTTLKRFVASDYDWNSACEEATRQCQDELRYRRGEGRYRYARCETPRGNPGYPDQPYPSDPGRGSYRNTIDLTCQSTNGRYTRCSVQGRGRVTNVVLLRQYRGSQCQMNSTFGIGADRSYIWTDRGCSGQFRVTLNRGQAPYPDYPRHPNDPFNPNDPFEPNEPFNPNDPFEPDEPFNPNDPFDPNGPFDPNDPFNPNGPYDPDGPFNPHEPVITPL